jgi:PTS system mannose-specific IIA component
MAPEPARIGVVVVGHGESASRLVSAARSIVGAGLEDLIAIDAGDGQTPELAHRLCDAIARADRGRGVLLLVDLLGSSPSACSQREAGPHPVCTVGGLNLAMLLKLGSSDRAAIELGALAEACVESGRRAVAATGT